MKILLADDNYSSRVSVANFIRKLGYQVDEYEDGYSALKGFLVNNYGMVLTDIKMPKMTGIDLLRAISASPYWNNVDVVLFTGHMDLDYAIQALRLGAYDYLLKPLKVKELAEVTERIAERRKKSRKKINIMLLHSNSLFGEGLKYIFTKSNKFNFVGEEETFEKSLNILDSVKVDIILVDLEHFKYDTTNFCETIKDRFPGLKIVFLYSHKDLVSESIKKCGSLCINKDSEARDIIYLLEQVDKGKDVSSYLTTNQVINEKEDELEKLTPKECKVLELLARKKAIKDEKLAALGTMAAGIAHEINQPLNSLKVNVDSILYWYEKFGELDEKEVIDKLKSISLEAKESIA